jgi:hypothetical protein
LITKVDEKTDAFLKGMTQQWWHVGPLNVSLEYRPGGKCTLMYHYYRENRGVWYSDAPDFREFKEISEAIGLEYYIQNNGAGTDFFTFSSDKIEMFLNALDKHLEQQQSEVGL